MGACQPLVDEQFVRTVTGAEFDDVRRVDELISVASELIAQEMQAGRCLDPETTSMPIKIVCARFVWYMLQMSDQSSQVRSESVGDYRVEYQSPIRNMGGWDLQMLKIMLAPYRNRSFTLKTVDKQDFDLLPVVGLE